MSLSAGGTVWGARLNWPNDDDYFSYTLAEPLGAPGGSATVYKLSPRTDPPLVGKLYHDSYLDLLRQDKKLLQRVVLLARHRDDLGTDLPFATWPRRLLFSSNTPTNVQDELLGFSMERLNGTVSLFDLIYQEDARTRLTPDANLHIAITISDQVARMHRHPWAFVFSDMSPNNIHVTPDLKHVRFIDTDCFQFQFKSSNYSFKASGLTPTFSSPSAKARITAGHTLDATHDDFLLAMLIFMMLMAEKGVPIHPFQASGFDEDTLIQQRAFPFDNPTAYPVNAHILATYISLPAEIRAAFTRSFTQEPPLPAAEWAALLAKQRRLLWQSH